MPSLKLSNPFRQGVDRPSLRERAAALKATAGRVLRRKPQASSAEAVAAMSCPAIELAGGVSASEDRVPGPSPDLVRLIEAWQALAVEIERAPDRDADELVLRHVEMQIAICDFPAASAADLLVKVPVFRDELQNALGGLDPDAAPETTLSGAAWLGLFRDFEHLAAAPPPERAEPAASLACDILAGWKTWAAVDGTSDTDEAEGLADGIRNDLLGAAEKLPATLESLPVKALALAWIMYADLWAPGLSRGDYAMDGRLALDIHEAAVSGDAGVKWRAAHAGEAAAAERAGTDRSDRRDLPGVFLAGLDFSSLSMRTLDTMHAHVETLVNIGFGLAAQPCSHRPDGGVNEAGAVMYRLAEDLLPWVADACREEARRRTDAKGDDARVRAWMLARPTVENDDPDEIRAFARDLLVLAGA